MDARLPNLWFDVTKPPPPIDDTFPPVALLEQLRIADQAFVDNFLLSRGLNPTDVSKKQPPPDAAPVDISLYRAELREALLAVEELKHSKHVLEHLHQTPDEVSGTKWNEELERVDQLEKSLQAKLQALEDPERLKSLTQKLVVRKKKRAWQKRRNLRAKKEQEDREAERAKRMEEIAHWETEWKDRLEKEKAAREELQAKTLVLADVRRRKAWVKRYLNRFQKTIKLHQQRQTMAAASLTQESPSTGSTEARFRSDVNALIVEWKLKLSECVREEKQLKDELARRSSSNESRRRNNQWRKVLFGDATATIDRPHPITERLIERRRAWDRYVIAGNQHHHPPAESPQCSSSIKASPVPYGWVLPPENPSPEWAVYRATAKSRAEKNADSVEKNQEDQEPKQKSESIT